MRAGALAAVVGGGVWAATFAIGTIVEWGRYGNDVGFLVLVAAAAMLLLAQAALAATSGPSHHLRVWLGAGISSLGVCVLVVALIGAVVLERPLAIRLGWSPREYWEAGMLLAVTGAALSALPMVPVGSLRGIAGVMTAGAAVPLVFALLAAVDGPTYRAIGGGGGAQMTTGQHGWFVSDMRVSLGGVCFGVGWVIVGIEQLRHGAFGHRARGDSASPIRVSPHEV
jgi:hypothetical protein